MGYMHKIKEGRLIEMKGKDIPNITDIPCSEGTGRVVVQAYTASGSLPVENAKITIADKSGNVLYELYTDNSGRTAWAKLCVPRAANSQREGGRNTYGAFDITVEKQGYYTEKFLNAAVFDGVDSIQPAFLEPLGENVVESDVRPGGRGKDTGEGSLSDNSARVGDALVIREDPKPVADTNPSGQGGV